MNVFIQHRHLQDVKWSQFLSWAILNSKFSFTSSGCLNETKEPTLPCYFCMGGAEQKDSCLSLKYQRKVKYKQLHPGFELVSPIPFYTAITVKLSVPRLNVMKNSFLVFSSFLFPNLNPSFNKGVTFVLTITLVGKVENKLINKEFPRYDSTLHRMIWRSVKRRVPIHWHFSWVNSDTEG